MKKALTAILALLPSLALAAPAASAPHGRDPARFGEMKAKQLQMLSQHIQVLQSAQRCVQAAPTGRGDAARPLSYPPPDFRTPRPGWRRTAAHPIPPRRPGSSHPQVSNRLPFEGRGIRAQYPAKGIY
ncbi:hypothetical protein [Pseudogulbenkiania ferrooxidans]|uniref:Uncharacterized protein n=1 Tax=Pseudogulbenkiania ferrooxidans EGD-HP2 TaxID=1388764 RepID=A0ABP2XNM5_9NEIS|nr:hypothetical protein [Pseudogulbenkiania ferrooxidans]ERE06363.1 hypothetical protein O166_08855 [Pseudogulbenkiania ferrooxidans EGD-HP2]